ncbi:yapsin, putative [Talaromyces stipitatus ATCC 10500]|uniref:Yapsin, putative n=1 Tax=Talaromyces stipitatus (strain ATCC 10500 / CBS 375.48 / QM 6759 / NRRL 1006) TaxID=441959 RepID=B8MHR3_TALSN|nr:yapsin, putative [Talaromyces stipitatus ATCC 10500]EED16393.1 yapsin, putative [Talaromyces stipitatus ATCC 10500]
MLSLRSLALLGLAASALAEQPKVLHMPMARNPNANRLAKRGSASVGVTNAVSEGLYYVNASVGTPGQKVQLVLDTGSSDIWFFGPHSCDAKTTECLGGIYNPVNSSTVKTYQPMGTFSIQYGTPNSNVTGNYITDAFSVGEASVKNLTMAYATYAAYVPTGVMGIGFDTNEAIVGRGGRAYPNFIDVLVSQNVIDTKAYSLWLNDLDSSSGSCLFGGYDTKKFTGELLTIDMQPDEQSGQFNSMTVAWTGLSITTAHGTQNVTSSSFASPALLDSGTTLSIIPNDIYEELLQFFQAQQDQQGDAIVDCGLLDSAEGSLDFTFGGANGPVIKVPFSEFALPAIGTDGSWLTFQDGSLACVLGLQGTGSQASSQLPVILGDTFLRSAYVVYDLENKQISLAQTVFNATDSNVVEITSASPVASVVTGAVVTQTATGNPNEFGGPTATVATGSSPTGSSGSGGFGGSDTAGTLTVSLPSVTHHAATSTSTSSSKNAANIAPTPDFMSTALIAGASMLLGGAFFVLH